MNNNQNEKNLNNHEKTDQKSLINTPWKATFYAHIETMPIDYQDFPNDKVRSRQQYENQIHRNVKGYLMPAYNIGMSINLWGFTLLVISYLLNKAIIWYKKELQKRRLTEIESQDLTQKQQKKKTLDLDKINTIIEHSCRIQKVIMKDSFTHKQKYQNRIQQHYTDYARYSAQLPKL